jgi:hypothetical protein
MPLGPPEGPTASQWRATVNSLDTVGEYPVAFNIVATTDNPDLPGMAPIVQKFVDLLASSPDFRLTGAFRTYSYSERMTPTG